MGFHEILKNYFDNSGLTQEEIAEKIGCSQSYLSRILKRKKIPSPDILLKLASALKLSKNEEMKFIVQAFKEKCPPYINFILDAGVAHLTGEKHPRELSKLNKSWISLEEVDFLRSLMKMEVERYLKEKEKEKEKGKNREKEGG